MFSSLCDSIVLAHENNYTKGRTWRGVTYRPCKFTPHMMAGILSGEQCARNIFGNPLRGASANYCIGNAGDLVGCVDENNRPWTSSSRANDYQAITVEVSNCEYGGQWRISDAAWNTLVKLAVDVCRRYSFRLEYNGTPNGSLTTHNMFANTDCPGPYLLSKMNELAITVNALLDGETPPPQPTPSPMNYTFEQFVRDVQATCGLTGKHVDGIPGPETLDHTITVSTSTNKYHPIVTVLERWFKQLGYYDGEIEADLGRKPIFGNGMKSAVKQYQSDSGLKVVDGIITAHANTWRKLLRLY